MDYAIFSSRIFTGNPVKPWAEALKITDDRITHVGGNPEIKKACGRNTEMLDLSGRLVTPGLVDAHCHFLNLGRSFQMVNLRNASSLAEVRERIQKAVVSRRPGDWIVGRGWNHHQWQEGREPTLKDLDDIVPDNPAMMVRACGHSIWVNTAALDLAGVSRETPNPAGGQIDKDPDSGEPTGLLREARDIIEAHMLLAKRDGRWQIVRSVYEVTSTQIFDLSEGLAERSVLCHGGATSARQATQSSRCRFRSSSISSPPATAASSIGPSDRDARTPIPSSRERKVSQALRAWTMNTSQPARDTVSTNPASDA